MHSPNLEQQLAALGYTADWLEFGLLNLDTLHRQTDELERGDDPNAEHYRYDTFRNYLCNKDVLTDAELDNFIALANHDPDPLMASAALVDVLHLVELNDSQFGELCEQLEARDEPIAKIAKRERLVRAMNQHGLTDALFSDGLDSADTAVHEHMLPIANYEQLRQLAESGTSRKIRNAALRRQQTLDRSPRHA